MRKIVFLILAMFLLSGCSKGEIKNLNSASIAAVYTSSLEADSQLIFTNEDGREIYNKRLKKQGIFTIFKNGNTLKLPVRFSDEIVDFDLEKRKTKEKKVREFPLYYEDIKGKEFTIYNSDEQGDIDYLTYESKVGGNTIVKRIKGFPQSMTIHKDKAYVYTDDVSGSKRYINIIDLEDLEIENKIDVDCEQVGDIKVLDDWIILTDVKNSRVIRISNNNPEKREIKQLNAHNPQFIVCYENRIVIVHLNYISVLNDKLEVVGTLDIKNQILRAKSYGDKIYLLTQDNGGSIIRVDMNNLAIEKIIELGERKGLLVQDFEVI